MADHTTQDIMNSTGEIISCSDPKFSDGAWLSYDDISALESEIEKFKAANESLLKLVDELVLITIQERKNQDVKDLEFISDILRRK